LASDFHFACNERLDIMSQVHNERGCIPCFNCCVAVPQDKFVAVEYFGSFYQTLRPGLNWAGFDVAGLCVALRSISARTQQLDVKTATKSKDNVFCTVHISVQFAVNPQQCEDAIYKLGNVNDQIEAYVSNIVRSKVPKMDIDEAFEAKDDLSTAISDELAGCLSEYGFSINNVLCTEIQLHKSVMDAMNEINRQKRLRDAAIMQAEAHKIRVVKAAEAQAEAAELQGDGLARQRSAIIDGLRTAVLERGDHKATTEELSRLMLVSQYFETMKQIGSGQNSKTFVMPPANPADPETQLRTGWLQAKAGLEGIRDRGPAQQSMGRNDARSASPPVANPRRQQRSTDARRPSGGAAPEREEPRRREPSPAMRQAPASHPPRPSASQPPPRAAPQVAPVRQPVTLQIQVPPNAVPGSTLQCQAPDGRVVQVQIPQGVRPGQLLQLQI